MNSDSEKNFTALLATARKLVQSADYDSALEILEDIEGTSREFSTRIDSLIKIGNIYFYRGDYTNSLSVYHRALAFRETR